MVAELDPVKPPHSSGCSLAKISMVAERLADDRFNVSCCSLAKISMVAERPTRVRSELVSCSLAKISMVAEQFPI